MEFGDGRLAQGEDCGAPNYPLSSPLLPSPPLILSSPPLPSPPFPSPHLTSPHLTSTLSPTSPSLIIIGCRCSRATEACCASWPTTAIRTLSSALESMASCAPGTSRRTLACRCGGARACAYHAYMHRIHAPHTCTAYMHLCMCTYVVCVHVRSMCART